MHELSIAQYLIEAAESEARRRGATSIQRVCCQAGCLRQIDPHLMNQAFEIARVGTLAASAALEIDSIGMELACRSCGDRTTVNAWHLSCPSCGSPEIRLEGGSDLVLVALDMEVPDDDPSPAKKPAGKERSRRPAESNAAR